MNCREHQEFFSDLYDGNLPPERRRELEAHLASCAECRAEFEEFSSSLHALREGNVPVPGDTFVRRIVDTARSETERIALYQNTGVRRPTTRRMTASRRPLWAIPAVAAAALGAFALGFLVQKQAADQEIRELQEQISRAENRPVIKNPDSNPPPFDTQKIIEQFAKEANLVRVDGSWVNAEIRDRLEKGEAKIDGQWVDAKKEVERLKGELGKGIPGDLDPKALEARVLEQHDLVRRGDWLLPRKWAEALDKGQVLAANGEPREMEEVIGDKLRDLGFVKLDGRWMTSEQRTQVLAARRIQKGDGVAAPAALVRALDGLEIAAPLGFRNLMIYPLVATGERTVAVSTLPDALAALEFVDDGNALQVRVKNKGDSDVALFAGELLAGGRHDRVIARDMIVPARKDRTVDVFDVEPAQLRAADKTAFSKTGGARLASLGLCRLLNEEVGQGGVWAFIAGRTPPMEQHREHKAAMAEFRAALQDLRAPNPNIVGVAVVVGDAIAAIEVFGSPALFASQFERVLDSAALEAIVANDREIRFPSDLAASPLGVRRLAESAFGADAETEGDAVVLRRNGRALGRMLTTGGEPVRAILFPDGPESRRSAVDLAIREAKTAHVLQAYLARLQQPNGNRKPALIREMAMLPGADARNAVIQMAKGPYRKEAVEALGLRGDPAAGEVLVRWLKESRKEGQAMYPELAKALAHIASEEGAQALAEDLDGKDVRIAKAAAEHLPGLLTGLRNLNALEAVMTNAITALSRIDATPDSHGTTWPHRALMALTQKNFAKPSEYSLWWSLPNNRADFLERFTPRR